MCLLKNNINIHISLCYVKIGTEDIDCANTIMLINTKKYWFIGIVSK